jgi:hypothetical protein
MLGAAHALANRGLYVFPCKPRAKSPATLHGFKDATVDHETIERWWCENPEFNVAIATGSVSDLLVLDVDDGCTGERALSVLEREHEPLPPTINVITPGDATKLPGRHLWLRLPPGVALASTAGRLGARLDTRADGGYVLAPPSMGPLGRGYHWSCDHASYIAEAPEWLLNRIALTAQASATSPEEWRRLAAQRIPKGRRDTTLTRLAGHLLRRYVNIDVVLLLLRGINQSFCLPPLPDADVLKIVNSIAGRELRKRGLVHDNK